MTVEMDKKRQQRIMERLTQIPKAYRGIYKKAVQGKSLRAAVNAQCLDCVYWQRKEVSLCTDLACPLWLVRPYQSLQDANNEPDFCAGATNTEEGYIG